MQYNHGDQSGKDAHADNEHEIFHYTHSAGDTLSLLPYKMISYNAM